MVDVVGLSWGLGVGYLRIGFSALIVLFDAFSGPVWGR